LLILSLFLNKRCSMSYKYISKIHSTQHIKCLLLLNCSSILFHDLCCNFIYARNDKISAILLENNNKVTIINITSAIILNEKHRRLHVNTTQPRHKTAPFLLNNKENNFSLLIQILNCVWSVDRSRIFHVQM
jgi:hypothetical protein